MDERYLEAMGMFQTEIGNLRDKYNGERQQPELPWNMPPFAGRIMWIRQLYKRILEPMKIFKTKDKVMRHRDTQKCIQMYNSLACVFVHYEKIYHKAWFDNLGKVRSGLGAPLILLHPQTKLYCVNYDPFIVESIRETEYMFKLGLPIPDSGQVINFCKEKIFHTFEMIKMLVSKNYHMRKGISKLFLPLMRPPLLEVQNAFQPGMSIITWASSKTNEYFDEINNILDKLERFLKEVNDLKSARIDDLLQNISEMMLIKFPNEPVYPQDLLKMNVKYKGEVGKELELRSLTVEKAVYELINKFMDVITEPEMQAGKYNWMDPVEAVKPVGSLSRLQGGDELGKGDVPLF